MNISIESDKCTLAIRELKKYAYTKGEPQMTIETTDKHHTWTATDEAGQEWEYRAQIKSEDGDKTGWEAALIGTALWTNSTTKRFCFGTVYRRPVRPKFATLMHPNGYEVRVYWEDDPDMGDGWYILVGTDDWEESVSSAAYAGCVYRRAGGAA